ncbi:BIG1-domain-containing protein [Pleurostoma richardsiae]|uniref:Protein BIG1 n=1 Tax=Pleurostoma richardsiae TaxID=41990 RepID=A0AA38RC60_9PEZI|nr:BIG1-domain-containing protein [Pleurostoma richardsiae]
MRFSVAAGLLAAATAQAFSDSSPFALFSTADFETPSSSKSQLQTGAQVRAAAEAVLRGCPTSRYVLVSQPNAHASDLRNPSGKCLAPNLCRAISDKAVRGQFSVAEVLGDDLSMDALSAYIKGACLEAGRDVKVEEHSLPALPAGKTKRESARGDNDHELGQILGEYAADGDYTVIYLSSPHELGAYEPDFIEPVRMELKRQAQAPYVGRRQDDDGAGLPLFEKYQFFTPGLFMIFIAVLVMLAILYAGLSALSSLEVSYGAFDKEMGPAAQKKQL